MDSDDKKGIDPAAKAAEIVKEEMEALDEYFALVAGQITKWQKPLEAAIAACEEVGVPERYSECPARLSWTAGSLQGVLITWDGIKDFREVVPLLQALAAREYHLKGKPNDYVEIRRRVWSLGEGEEIKVMAFLTDDEEGAVCRVIETGEMEAVKKFICPDDEGDIEHED